MPRPAGAVVRDLGLLVHRGADAVADVLADHREPGRSATGPRPRHRCRRAVPSTVAAMAASSAAPGDVDEPLGLRVDLADRDRDRGVGVPALDDRPAVDRDDVASSSTRCRRGCRARSPRSARCRRPRGSRGSRGSSSGRPRRSSTSRAARSRSAVVAPGTAARTHDLVHLGDDRAGAPHERDLRPRSCAGPSATATRMLVDDLDEPLEHLVALADPVDHRPAGRVAGSSRRSGRSRARTARAAVDRLLGVVVALAHGTAARVAHPVCVGRHVHVVLALAALADPAARDAVEHDLAWDVEVDDEVQRAPASTRSSSRAWCNVRGNRRARSRRRAGRPARCTPRSRRRRSRRAPARPRPCSASPRARTRCPARPARGTCRRSRRAIDAVVLRQTGRPGCPSRHLASRAARVGALSGHGARRGSPRSSASSAGCRSASWSRA